ncbi:PilZ domain-containing protein [Terasakiella sp. A23]|uniref:PilZ domain-containing protein n=1 Tax=Terasakiella sp. FCG-A23 TaxID=3080561 RepID=UPI002953DEFF|nr:PilZ domain-containing protein [Terasakiella sp. A23]MDV7338544.1 PilZ domain-containing protein [Terasakiella sp. A23]
MFKPVNMDKRSSRRHEINVVANLISEGKSHSATVLDISTGGAKIVLKNSTLLQSSDVQIDLPFLNELDAYVIWAHGEKCGLKFNDDQDRLSEFLYNLAVYGTAHSSE